MANKIVFRMSESGKCARDLSAQLLGYEPTPAPDWLARSAEEGKWHEDRIKDELFEEGYFVHDEQQEITLDFPNFQLIGHIDGKVIKDGEWSAYTSDKPMPSPQLLEIKSMSQFEFDRWMRGNFKEFPQYASQITCYMESTGLKECLYIVKNRNNGYEDRRILTQKPAYMTEIIAQLVDVVNNVLAKRLVPAEFDPQALECRRCEYKHLCIPEPKELTPLEKADLESATEEWRKGKALVEKGQALIDTAKQALEEHTKATNQTKWSFNGLAIQLVHYGEQITYPKSKLLQHLTEEQLKPCEQVKEAYDQLRVNDLEGDND